MKSKKNKKMSMQMKKEMQKIILDNRAVGGIAWQDYTKKEILDIFGYMPYWAADLKAE